MAMIRREWHRKGVLRSLLSLVQEKVSGLARIFHLTLARVSDMIFQARAADQYLATCTTNDDNVSRLQQSCFSSSDYYDYR